MTQKVVILAGGSGSRLWPYSRQKFPKQVLKLIGKRSLLQETCLRFRSLQQSNIHVVTNKEQQFLISKNLDEIGLNSPELVIEEPYARNTAPAICLAALKLKQNDVMIVLPSDQLIPDHEKFQHTIDKACELAERDYLVTLGIKASYAETGYGYIHRGSEIDSKGFFVDRFVEKPTEKRAKSYVESGDYYWNSGIFIWRVSAILNEFEKYCPDVLEMVRNYVKTINSAFFYDVQNISIDYAILEKSKKVAVVEGDFTWSDLGSWKSVYDIQDKDPAGNVINGKALINNSTNIFVHNTSESRLVATVGIKDTTIIDTDDAVIVCNNKQTQEVKKIVDDLKLQNSDLINLHKTVYRPWGYYKILEDTDYFKSKRLVIYPKQSISLQYHNKRAETWTVVKGVAEVTCNETIKSLSVGESVHIPAGTKHRVSNKQSIDVEIIEVQTGTYFGEDDIIRIEDQYNRAEEV